MRFYDNTRVSSFRTCPRQFYFRHIKHLSPTRTRYPLVFGSSWHDAMDVVWEELCKLTSIPSDETKINIAQKAWEAFQKRWVEEGLTPPKDMGTDELKLIQPRDPYNALEMLYNYVDERAPRLCRKDFELVEIEKPFAVPLDPEDETLFYVGRLDKVFKFQEAHYFGEHKTSSLSTRGGKSFQSSFIDSFSPNSQVDGYLYVGHMLYGDKFKAVWIDGALVHKETHDLFRFLPVERRFSQLDAWLWECRDWIDRIEGNSEAAEQTSPNDPYMSAFAKNTGACNNYGRCDYMDICKMWANPVGKEIPPGFEDKKWSPFDELKLAKLGLENVEAKSDD